MIQAKGRIILSWVILSHPLVYKLESSLGSKIAILLEKLLRKKGPPLRFFYKNKLVSNFVNIIKFYPQHKKYKFINKLKLKFPELI